MSENKINKIYFFSQNTNNNEKQAYVFIGGEGKSKTIKKRTHPRTPQRTRTRK